MAKIEYIKHLYEVEGKSLREIAEMVGVNFRTVKKYAYMHDFTPHELPRMAPEEYPVLGAYIPIIDEWMEADMREPRKQRHTAMRIWARLRDEAGFTGCYSSVKRYVAKKRWQLNRARDGHLPIAQPPEIGRASCRERV